MRWSIKSNHLIIESNLEFIIQNIAMIFIKTWAVFRSNICTTSTPQFHTNPLSSTQGPHVFRTKIFQFNTKNPSVQHQNRSAPDHKPLSSTHPSVPHQKPRSSKHLLVLNWGVCWTARFLVLNWGVFGVKLRDFGS